ncbi:MAG: hypothetical protein WBL23_17825 [Salinisphaera sp.]|uniref:hypothetical protein n=1 Tax=Salinisphaera sp. TaxID=1914330 RepID=UPI003C7B5EE6
MAKSMGVKKMSVSVNLDNLLNDRYVTGAGYGPIRAMCSPGCTVVTEPVSNR